jgi:hypothetical protein
MIEGVEKIVEQCSKGVNYFFDSTHTRLKRFAMAFFILLAFAWLNDLTGFLFYMSVTRKTERIEQIEKVLSQPNVDSTTRAGLIDLKQNVFNHSSFVSRFSNFLMDLFKSTKHQTITTNPMYAMSLTDFLHVFTAAYGFIILFVVILFVPFIGDKMTLKQIPLWIGALIALLLLIYLFAFAFSFIPVIQKGIVWNYPINFAIQTLFTVWLFKRLQKLPPSVSNQI